MLKDLWLMLFWGSGGITQALPAAVHTQGQAEAAFCSVPRTFVPSVV